MNIKEQIDRIAAACKQIKPLVAIRCITYNHDPYIHDALEGFVMQKTTFHFVAIVHDDASTDGTAAIIREYAEKYPDIILPIYEEENQYSKKDGSIRNIMNDACMATGAKYYAICEGDDYWIDPLKLQKQVDYLNTNPDVGMVYTKSRAYIQKENKWGDIFGGETSNSFESVVTENHIPAQSTMYRSCLYYEYIEEIAPGLHNWKMGDYPMHLWFAYNSKIEFMPECTSVYRCLEESASHYKRYTDWLNFRIDAFYISYYFTERYNKSLSEIPRTKILWYELEKFVLKKDIDKAKECVRQIIISRTAPMCNKEKLLLKLYHYPSLYRILFKLYTKLSHR